MRVWLFAFMQIVLFIVLVVVVVKWLDKPE